MKTVRLQIGNSRETNLEIRSITFPSESMPVKIINAWQEDEDGIEHPDTTLKDISIIMWSMVGAGVTWQLASELSNRLNLHNPAGINNILENMFSEFYELSDEEAEKRYDDAPRLYDPQTG